MADASDLEHLPKAPNHIAGESIDRDESGRYDIKVSNASGYLCHIHLESTYDCPPQTIFRIFTNPDNTGVFRDVKKRGKRRVLELDPAGRKIVEVEQIGEAKVLWKRREFTTLLKVDEDERDPNNLITAFSLIRSDILSRFNGSWSLQPILNEEETHVVGTRAVLDQDILPAGAPAFLAHVPILGGALRGICVRAVKRLVEDLNKALDRIRSGEPIESVLTPPQPVQSHVLDDDMDSEDEVEQNGKVEERAAEHKAVS
ncbi:hypothetical protein CVIRNUC_008953 [Coccomyxa viridis]|uniref:Uncharacterized protein n=1 Tax=Coccomyxa viridis TaxID=1274662 RepID=A0AAV1IHQ7_9CHLO|nr:hypothetical protein CVIRNUC_008953 [Coccomyxa viridis]